MFKSLFEKFAITSSNSEQDMLCSSYRSEKCDLYPSIKSKSLFGPVIHVLVKFSKQIPLWRQEILTSLPNTAGFDLTSQKTEKISASRKYDNILWKFGALNCAFSPQVKFVFLNSKQTFSSVLIKLYIDFEALYLRLVMACSFYSFPSVN